MGSEELLPIFLGQGLIAVVFGLGVLVRELAQRLDRQVGASNQALKELRQLVWQHLQDRKAHH